MIKDITILFLSALGGGLMVFLVKKINTIAFKLSLVFAGAYLFSITIIHLLPDLFSAAVNPSQIGFFILLGFFMQIFIAQLTSGVEHGHIHEPATNSHDHAHYSASTLLIALCIHSFMEGTLLAHPAEHVHDHGSHALLIGIVLHKMPAAFALMSVLRFKLASLNKALLLLVIFSLASPLGLLFSVFFHDIAVVDDTTFLIIYALVCGNFLHISTTIFFENSPEHKFHFKKLIVSIIGAFLAVMVEFFL